MILTNIQYSLFLESTAGLFKILGLFLLLNTSYIYPKIPGKGQKAEDFIPKGYKIIKQVKGHLNGDNIMDQAVIIESKKGIDGLKETDHTQKPRILFVITGLKKSGYMLSVQSNESVMLDDDGGLLGDPLQDMYILDSNLHITYYGGSRERWLYDYKWKLHGEKWFLAGAEYTTMDPVENIKTSFNFNFIKSTGEKTEQQYLEDDEGKPKTKPINKRIRPEKKELMMLDNFRFGQNMVYKEVYF